MDIQFILNELYEAGVLESDMKNLKPLTGGTSSEVVVVMDGTRPRYVIKQNDPAIVKAEAEFLYTYAQIEKLSRLVYVDPLHRYVVYTFKPGFAGQYCEGNKGELLLCLVTEVIAQYKSLGEERNYGYPDHRFVHTLVAGTPQRRNAILNICFMAISEYIILCLPKMVH
ncbi:hypothetical protein [Paenibacillus ottowii]|uniref:hypothetical protein n=1 Tax=Paenibacillus ottowii TaxID=2315729 RepID=UPI001FCB086F|nr:hypothetical protein [Paenibacillus ottowii]